MGFRPPGHSRPDRADTVPGACIPSWCSPRDSRSRRGLTPRHALHLQGLASRSDRHRLLPVSLPQGLAALLDFLSGPASLAPRPSANRRTGQASAWPHHVPDCQRATTFERVCRTPGSATQGVGSGAGDVMAISEYLRWVEAAMPLTICGGGGARKLLAEWKSGIGVMRGSARW